MPGGGGGGIFKLLHATESGLSSGQRRLCHMGGRCWGTREERGARARSARLSRFQTLYYSSTFYAGYCGPSQDTTESGEAFFRGTMFYL